MLNSSQWKRIASGDEAPACTDRCRRSCGYSRAGKGRDPDVRDDDGVDPGRGGDRDGVLPELELAGGRKGVDGQQNLAAPRMGIVDRLAQFVGREIQSGKVPRIGRVLQAAIDGVGAGIDRGAQAGRRSGRTDQFGTPGRGIVIHDFSPCRESARRCETVIVGDRRERTERPGDAFHDPAVDVVERIAQRDHGFGVAGDAQLAREEQRVAVERAVDQIEQIEERARDTRVGIGRVVAPPGAERGSLGSRFQHQHERKIGGVDDEGFQRVRPEPQENIGLAFRNLGADETENGLQKRKRQEAKKRKRRSAIGCGRRSEHAISVAPRTFDSNSVTRSLERF